MPTSLRIGLLLLVGLCLAATSAQAQISVVVAISSSHAANQAQVKDFFSGARLTWTDGSKVQVVDQPDTELSETFYKTVVGRSPAQVRVQWTKLVLSGQAKAPVKGKSDAEVKAAVSGNPNAIGFIATSALDDSVKELVRIE
ncbi:MAG: phosphate ABC transporter substrate-binding protein [Rhodothermales bacterium]